MSSYYASMKANRTAFSGVPNTGFSILADKNMAIKIGKTYGEDQGRIDEENDR